SGSYGSGLISAAISGAQPRWVHRPTSTETSGLSERSSGLAWRTYSGCWSALSDLGSRRRSSRPGSASSTALERLTIQIGCPRHSRTRRWPSCRALISAVTGAPASFARVLGFHDLMNGTAAKPAPTAPTTAVVAVRNRRRPVFTGAWTSSLAIRHSENLDLVALAACDRLRPQKTPKCNGTLNGATMAQVPPHFRAGNHLGKSAHRKPQRAARTPR